jgi:hypothetical protein
MVSVAHEKPRKRTDSDGGGQVGPLAKQDHDLRRVAVTPPFYLPIPAYKALRAFRIIDLLCLFIPSPSEINRNPESLGCWSYECYLRALHRQLLTPRFISSVALPYFVVDKLNRCFNYSTVVYM